MKKNAKSKNELHITIGVASMISDDMNATAHHHLRLAKAGILYADRITLCSPVMSLLMCSSRTKNLTEREIIELIELCGPSLGQDARTMEGITLLRRLVGMSRADRRKTKADSFIADLKRSIVTSGSSFHETGKKLYKEMRIAEFEKAIDAGKLEVKNLGPYLSPIQLLASAIQKSAELDSILTTGDFNISPIPGNRPSDRDAVMEDYFNELEKAIQSNTSYPLFDDDAGNLVRLGLKEGRITASEVEVGRAKPIGLAADLMERLPTFDTASMEEILDIRRELERPLINFRSGMIKFSREMKSAAWDSDFPKESDEVFRSEIQPAIQQLEDSVRSNRYLIELWNMVPEKPFNALGAGALGAGLSALQGLSEVVTVTAGTLGGLALASSEAYKKFSEKKKTVEDNQLFFYYQAGKRLEQENASK